ncbi:MAG: Smr/MutS family protein [Bacteroidota bacterium]
MSEDPIELPIDGILDLHLFQPKEIKTLIPDYIEACLEKDIVSVRIIHGKGKGVLRRTVHALLDRNPQVVSYRLADDQSSWGATLVELKK